MTVREPAIRIILGYGGYLVYQGPVQCLPAGGVLSVTGGAIVWPIMAVSMPTKDQPRQGPPRTVPPSCWMPLIDVADRPAADLTDRGGTEFCHLNFRHPTASGDVLRIFLPLVPGEKCGIIVGKTGGKTAPALLLRT